MTFKVKETFSIGKDTYEISEGNRLIYKIKSKMLSVGGKRLVIEDSRGEKIGMLKSNMLKRKWKIEVEGSGDIGEIKISGLAGRKLSLKAGGMSLDGKINRRKRSVKLDGGGKIWVQKNFSFKDIYEVDVEGSVPDLPATMVAVVIDQLFHDG